MIGARRLAPSCCCERCSASMRSLNAASFQGILPAPSHAAARPRRTTSSRSTTPLPPPGDAARAGEQVFEVHLPLEGGAAPFGSGSDLLVDRLAPAQVLLLFQEDVLQDAHGGSVADRVGDGEV